MARPRLERWEAVANPIRIEMGSAVDGRDLIDTLARRGLIGELVLANGRWEVEIDSPREEAQRLLLDVEDNAHILLFIPRTGDQAIGVGDPRQPLDSVWQRIPP